VHRDRPTLWLVFLYGFSQLSPSNGGLDAIAGCAHQSPALLGSQPSSFLLFFFSISIFSVAARLKIKNSSAGVDGTQALLFQVFL
jgi:hypothetical protein